MKCPQGHDVTGDNAEPFTGRPGKFRCRICRGIQRRHSDNRRRGKEPPLPVSQSRALRERQFSLAEEYEFISSVQGGNPRDIAVRLGVSPNALYGALKARGVCVHDDSELDVRVL